MKIRSWTITEVGDEDEGVATEGTFKLSINIQELDSMEQGKQFIKKLRPIISKMNGQETIAE